VVDPVFWLGLSLLLVAVSLTAVLMAALPALRELARAARSAEKLFDTLSRELPPTLEAIRLTGLEITDLTDEVGESVQSAGRVVRQVDRSVTSARQQAHKAQQATRSVMVGFRAAWRSLTQPLPPPPTWDEEPAHTYDRLPASRRTPLDHEDDNGYSYADYDDVTLYEPDRTSSASHPDPTWPGTTDRE